MNVNVYPVSKEVPQLCPITRRTKTFAIAQWKNGSRTTTMKPIINLVQSSPQDDNRSTLVTWGFDTIGIIYGASVVRVRVWEERCA